MLKKTPLFEVHRSHNARLVDFSGFEMPVQYKGISEEHRTVRRAAGLFDVSHMGEILVRGDLSSEVVQELITNDVNRLSPGKALYTVMCRDNGGIVDDLLVYCLESNEYMLVVNASNIQKDFEWILQVNRGRAEISNMSDEIALIALQGPSSPEILSRMTTENPEAIPGFEFRSLQLAGYGNVLVSATGYTGEKGYELYCNIRHVNVCDLWEKIMDAGKEFGLAPCGLGARDTLRLEAGLALYGNDLDETTNPLEAGMSWLVKWDKGEFRGKDALMKAREQGPARKLTGLVMKESKKIPRKGYPVYEKSGQVIGEVTSGCHSFELEKGIAMAYLNREHATPGYHAEVAIRGKKFESEIVKLPFYKRS